jgi:hypothetical protein
VPDKFKTKELFFTAVEKDCNALKYVDVSKLSSEEYTEICRISFYTAPKGYTTIKIRGGDPYPEDLFIGDFFESIESQLESQLGSQFEDMELKLPTQN